MFNSKKKEKKVEVVKKVEIIPSCHQCEGDGLVIGDRGIEIICNKCSGTGKVK